MLKSGLLATALGIGCLAMASAPPPTGPDEAPYDARHAPPPREAVVHP